MAAEPTRRDTRLRNLYDHTLRIDPNNIAQLFDLAIDYSDIDKLKELSYQYPKELERIKETVAPPNNIEYFKGHYTRLMDAIYKKRRFSNKREHQFYNQVISFLANNPLIEIDFQDSRGTTALMVAADNNDTDSIRILLEAGANPDLTNNKGQTFHDILQNPKFDINEDEDDEDYFAFRARKTSRKVRKSRKTSRKVRKSRKTSRKVRKSRKTSRKVRKSRKTSRKVRKSRKIRKSRKVRKSRK